MAMGTRWVIGLGSGSGGEGVDAALVELEGAGLELRPRLAQAYHQAYGGELRALVRRASAPGPVETRQVSLLHRLLGETFAAAARAVADQASFSLQKVQCVGCPGHTVWHDVEGRFPSTLGLGMAAVVAERTGVTTVSDFRARDVAAAGQGVPLSGLTDYLLFRHGEENRLLFHLGGAARVVGVPRRSRLSHVVGFESGPCNLVLDGLMRHLTGGRESFDAGGKHAVQGRCIEPLLQRWLANPFFHRRPPKALPRHTFGDEFAAQMVHQAREYEGSLHDVLCTATHFVARGLVRSVERFVPASYDPDRILLSGGGVRNGLLWHLLEQQLPGKPLDRTDAVGIPAASLKALSLGILAALTLDGVAGNLPSATGAAGARLLGCLTPGTSSNWARCISCMAAQNAPPLGVD